PGLVAAALEALGEGVCISDPSGRLVYTNRMADHILGVTRSEDLPDHWSEHYGIFVPGSSDPFPSDQYPLVRALRGEATDEIEMTVRNPSHPHGALIAATGRPVCDGGGEIVGAFVVFRDVTAMREMERLSRLVPVCPWCRKVRSDQGYWQKLEA